MKHVLFLCTGNYYRSRFAECLFNELAGKAGLPWRAGSCGLRVQPDGVVNHGAISAFARTGLSQRHVVLAEPCRLPRQVCAHDLDQADLIIALKETEHRPMLEKLHPEQARRARYWHVNDMDLIPPEQGMREIDKQVRDLIDQLQ
jgi:protein-tyrosine phosphatase